jgi:hypothetical protein
MAATNACEAWVIWLGGLLITQSNYSIGFMVMCLVSLSGLIFLSKIKTQ